MTRTRWRSLGGLFVALVSGVAVMRFFRARRTAAWGHTGHTGLKNGAVSAVTGGHPEEMNEMPPNTDDNPEEPIFDGSALSRG